MTDPTETARAVLEAAGRATEGPWCVEGRRGLGYIIGHGICPEGDGPQGYVGALKPMFPDVEGRADDAAFIALSRTAAPALAQYALDASAEIERLREALKEIAGLAFESSETYREKWPETYAAYMAISGPESERDLLFDLARTALKDK